MRSTLTTARPRNTPLILLAAAVVFVAAFGDSTWAAEATKALTLCVSWKGDPGPPVRLQINQRPASREFTAEEEKAQVEGVDMLYYEDWIPDYYRKIGPASKLRNCVGTVLNNVMKLPGKYNVSSDLFYKTVLKSFATEIYGRKFLQVGDVVSWMTGDHSGHVGYVVHLDPVRVVTKDGDQAVYLHWIFKWDDSYAPNPLGHEDPLVKLYGRPRFFRMPVDDLRMSVSEQGKPCRGEVPDLIGMTREDAEQAIRDAGLEPNGQEGDLLPLKEVEREKVYEQNPKPKSMLDDGEPVHFKWYPPAPGFQRGDGAKVDSRFTAAKVTDGEIPPANLKQFNEGLAGERSAISFTSFPPGGATTAEFHRANSSWMAKKYSDPAAALNVLEEMIGVWGKTVGNTWEGGFVKVQKSLDPNDLWMRHSTRVETNEHVQGFSTVFFSRIFIYREQFLVGYALHSPDLETDFSTEDAQIRRNAGELIELRFPLRK